MTDEMQKSLSTKIVAEKVEVLIEVPKMRTEKEM